MSLALALTTGYVGAQEHGAYPRIELTEATAAAANMATHSFDFGLPSVSFTTYIPKSAKVETIKLDPARPVETPGRVTTIGKITLPPQDHSIETTVTAFQLTRAGAASLVCDWGLEEAGYQIIRSGYRGKFTEAEALGHAEGEANNKAAVLACYNRGSVVLTILTTVLLPKDEKAEDDAIKTIRTLAGAFFTNLRFADGKPSDYDPAQMQIIKLKLGEEEASVSLPAAFDIPINDFDGRAAPELMLMRKAEGEPDNKPLGLVWMSVFPDITGGEKLEPAAEALFERQLKLQFDTPIGLEKTTSYAEPAFESEGLDSWMAHYVAKGADKSDLGSAVGRTARKGGKLYSLTRWSIAPDTVDRSAFITRLPEMTAEIMLRDQLIEWAKR